MPEVQEQDAGSGRPMTDHSEEESERIAIMIADGGCTEEEAEAHVNSEEYKVSMDEWNAR